MRKLIIIVLCVMSCASCVSERLTQDALRRTPDYQTLYEDLLYPSVRIESAAGCGSGVVIASGVMRPVSETQDARPTTQDIYVLTAAHVVGDFSCVEVCFYDYGQVAAGFSLRNLKVAATVVATDTGKDLALLRCPYGRLRTASCVMRSGPETQDARLKTLRPARLAPRNYVPKIFTPVWVVGCALGLPPRPSEGIITKVHEFTGSRVHESTGELVNSSTRELFWEVSAPIWPGNSGGGVFLKDTPACAEASAGRHELIGIAVWVKVYRGQLVSTMVGVVPLQEIYEFLERARVLVN